MYISSLPSAVARTSYLVVLVHEHNHCPPEQGATQRTMSAPAGDGASDKVAIEVDSDDSPLSSASPEVVHLPRWDDLGRSYSLNCNLLHKFIPSFSLKGKVTKPRSSSSSRVVIPCLSSAVLQDGSYQPGRAYHSYLRRRMSCMGDRGAMGHQPTWASPVRPLSPT